MLKNPNFKTPFIHPYHTIFQPDNTHSPTSITEQPNQLSPINSPPPKKTVKFDSTALVILIPTIEEYCKAGLDKHLWFTGDELDSFKQAFVSCVREFIAQNSGISVHQAAQQLLLQDEDTPSTIESPPSSRV